MIERCLDDLEARLDPMAEDHLRAQWRHFADGRFTGDIFCPARPAPIPGRVEWPSVLVNQAIADPEAMLLQQFGTCSTALAQASGALPCVRANYGTAILPSLFGVDLFWMADEQDTLPTNWPLRGGRDALRAALDRGLPDLRTGLGARVLDMGARFVEAMAPYPKIRRYVTVYHPDLQGPLDVCELLWGSSLFLDLYDAPDFVAAMLELISETYTQFLRAWQQIVPPVREYAVHWGMLHRGRIMLRDDSAMNLSAEMFARFVAPYDGRLLREFGGGALHFCGKGGHYLPQAVALPGVNAVNLSQPEYNDMETIFRHTVDQGIPLLALPREAAQAALAKGRSLHGNVHCW